MKSPLSPKSTMLTKRLLFLLTLMLASLASQAQLAFQKVYRSVSDDFASSVCLSSDHHLLVLCGGSIIKYDSLGNEIWTKKYLPQGMYRSGIVKSQSNGGIILLMGITSGGIGGSDIMMFNLDSAGIVNWIRIYGTAADEEPTDVEEMPDGSFVISGSTSGFGGRGGLALLMCVNKIGDQLWQRCYGTTLGIVTSVALTNQGELLCCGSQENAFIMLTDAYGVPLWYREYFPGRLTSIVEDQFNGGYYACGIFQNPADSGRTRSAIIATDSSGEVIWRNLWGETHIDVANSLTLSPDGQNLLVSGYAMLSQGAAGWAAMLGLTDGVPLWCNRYGRLPGMNAFHGSVMAWNSSIFTGYSDIPSDSFNNVYLTRCRPDGESGCLQWAFTPTVDGSVVQAVLLPAFPDSGNMDVTTVCYPANTMWGSALILCASQSFQLQPGSLHIYPLPAEAGGSLFIELPPDRANSCFELYELSGTLLMQGRLKNGCIQLPPSLQAGMLLLRVISDSEHDVFTAKIPVIAVH